MIELYKNIMTEHSKEDLKKCGIYAIINKINNKMYIGSTRASFYNRWSSHATQLRNNDHCNYYFLNAWNKYGWENFEFKIIKFIEEYEIENLFQLEQHYMDYYKSMHPNGYNLMTCDTNIRILKTSKSTIEKMKNRQQNNKYRKINDYFIPSESDADNIRRLFFVNKYTSEYLTNLYNIEFSIFEKIVSGSLIDDLLFGDNYFDIKSMNGTYYNNHRKDMYCRERCLECYHYYCGRDYCYFYEVDLPNKHILTCNDQLVILDENGYNEISELESYFGIANIDELNEKYMNGEV